MVNPIKLDICFVFKYIFYIFSSLFFLNYSKKTHCHFLLGVTNKYKYFNWVYIYKTERFDNFSKRNMVYNTKKAAQGIGTLIIFIAMILVAAVAAGVLIQTASSLQSKSLDVGRQSQEKITTDIDVVQVYATGTQNNAITDGTDELTVLVRLGSGSSPINLDDLIIKMDTQSNSQTVSRGAASSITEYGVNYIINGSAHIAGYLVEGDLAEFTFTYDGNTADIGESESFTIRLIAKNGAVKPVDVTTPSAMVQSTTYLYP